MLRFVSFCYVLLCFVRYFGRKKSRRLEKWKNYDSVGGEKWGPSVPSRILSRFLHFPSVPKSSFGTLRKVVLSSYLPALGRLYA